MKCLLNFYHEMLESSSKYWNVYLYSSDGVTELFKNSVTGNNNGAFDKMAREILKELKTISSNVLLTRIVVSIIV